VNYRIVNQTIIILMTSYSKISEKDGLGPSNRTIPCDLVPTTRNGITHKWCQQTIMFAPLFIIQVNGNNISEKDRVEEWRKYVLNMHRNIINMGEKGYMKRVVAYLKEKKVIKETTEKSLIPKNFDDLKNILKSSDWYQSNLAENRSIFYDIIYGFFLRGDDEWLKVISHKWIANQGIAVDMRWRMQLSTHRCDSDTSIEGNKNNNSEENINSERVQRRRKTFIYAIMNRYVSDKIKRCFKDTMEKYHGEFLFMRKICMKGKSNEWYYEKYVSKNGGSCFIALRKKRNTTIT